MADSYHYHQQIISRAAGRSAVACAAYRSGERLRDEVDGREKRFGDPSRVVAHGIELHGRMPEELRDRATLWNSIELHERQSNAQLAREHEMSIPRDLSHDDRIELARSFAAEIAREGHAADWAVHRDHEGGGYHVHIMETLREWDADKGHWASKMEREYLVRDHDGNERHMRGDELRSRADEGWEKVFRYKTEQGRELLTQSQAAARGLENKDRVTRQPESRKVERDPWEGRKERIGEMRTRWQDRANESLERHYDREGTPESRRQSIDCRSYREIDRLQSPELKRTPTAHMGHERTKVEREERERCSREGREYRPITKMGRDNDERMLANRARTVLRDAYGRAMAVGGRAGEIMREKANAFRARLDAGFRERWEQMRRGRPYKGRERTTYTRPRDFDKRDFKFARLSDRDDRDPVGYRERTVREHEGRERVDRIRQDMEGHQRWR